MNRKRRIIKRLTAVLLVCAVIVSLALFLPGATTEAAAAVSSLQHIEDLTRLLLDRDSGESFNILEIGGTGSIGYYIGGQEPGLKTLAADLAAMKPGIGVTPSRTRTTYVNELFARLVAADIAGVNAPSASFPITVSPNADGYYSERYPWESAGSVDWTELVLSEEELVTNVQGTFRSDEHGDLRSNWIYNLTGTGEYVQNISYFVYLPVDEENEGIEGYYYNPEFTQFNRGDGSQLVPGKDDEYWELTDGLALYTKDYSLTTGSGFDSVEPYYVMSSATSFDPLDGSPAEGEQVFLRKVIGDIIYYTPVNYDESSGLAYYTARDGIYTRLSDQEIYTNLSSMHNYEQGYRPNGTDYVLVDGMYTKLDDIVLYLQAPDGITYTACPVGEPRDYVNQNYYITLSTDEFGTPVFSLLTEITCYSETSGFYRVDQPNFANAEYYYLRQSENFYLINNDSSEISPGSYMRLTDAAVYQEDDFYTYYGTNTAADRLTINVNRIYFTVSYSEPSAVHSYGAPYLAVPDATAPWRMVGEGETGYFVRVLVGFTFVGEGNGDYRFYPDGGEDLYSVATKTIFYSCNYTNNNWFARYVFDLDDEEDIDEDTAGVQTEVDRVRFTASTLTADAVTANHISAADLVVIYDEPGDAAMSRLVEEATNQSVYKPVILAQGIGASLAELTDVSNTGVSYDGDNDGNYVGRNIWVSGGITTEDGGIYEADAVDAIGIALAGKTFRTELTGAAYDGFDAVFQEIRYENFLRTQEGMSADQLLPTEVNMATILRYIINFSGQRQVKTKEVIEVLEIEPATSASQLTPEMVNAWLPGAQQLAEENIHITTMSSYELIGKIEDLNEVYDLIYIGSGLTGMNTRTGTSDERTESEIQAGISQIADYNDSDMDGLLYTNIGDTVETEHYDLAGLLNYEYGGGNSLTSDAKSFRYSGNDLTESKMEDLIEFAKAGYPVILADNLLANSDSGGERFFKAVITASSLTGSDDVTLRATLTDLDGETLFISDGVSYQWYTVEQGGGRTLVANADDADYTVAVGDSFRSENYCCVVTPNSNGSLPAASNVITIFRNDVPTVTSTGTGVNGTYPTNGAPNVTYALSIGGFDEATGYVSAQRLTTELTSYYTDYGPEASLEVNDAEYRWQVRLDGVWTDCAGEVFSAYTPTETGVYRCVAEVDGLTLISDEISFTRGKYTYAKGDNGNGDEVEITAPEFGDYDDPQTLRVSTTGNNRSYRWYRLEAGGNWVDTYNNDSSYTPTESGTYRCYKSWRVRVYNNWVYYNGTSDEIVFSASRHTYARTDNGTEVLSTGDTGTVEQVVSTAEYVITYTGAISGAYYYNDPRTLTVSVTKNGEEYVPSAWNWEYTGYGGGWSPTYDEDASYTPNDANRDYRCVVTVDGVELEGPTAEYNSSRVGGYGGYTWYQYNFSPVTRSVSTTTYRVARTQFSLILTGETNTNNSVTLTAQPFVDGRGADADQYTFEWYSGGSGGTGGTLIPGVTGNSMTLPASGISGVTRYYCSARHNYGGNDAVSNSVIVELERVGWSADASGTVGSYYVTFAVNDRRVDKASYMYQAISTILELENSNIMSDSSAKTLIASGSVVSVLDFLNLSKPEIEFSLNDDGDPLIPTEYYENSGGAMPSMAAVDGVYTLSYTFSIKNETDLTPLDSRYDCHLYLDQNSDGLYSDDEQISDVVIYRTDSGEPELVMPTQSESGGKTILTYHLRARVEYTLTRVMPASYVGIVPWKLAVFENTNNNEQSHIHDSVTGYTRIAPVPEQITEIHILQINSSTGNSAYGNGDTLNLCDQLVKVNSGGYYSNKTGARYRGLFGRLIAEVEDFNITIDTTTTQLTELEALDQSGYGTNVNNLALAIRESAESIYAFLDDYDMLILGFADMYGDLSEDAANAIARYIATGRAVLFSHDTNSFTNIRNWDSFNYTHLSGWGYQFNSVLRDSVGLDRYGVSSGDVGDLLKRQRTDSKLSTTDINSSLLANNYSVAYTPGSDRVEFNTEAVYDTDARTQGYSNYALLRARDTSDYTPYAGITTNRGSWSQSTTSVSQVNSGQITTYPYEINTDYFDAVLSGESTANTASNTMTVAPTHMQYYQVNMNSDDIVVWYCLSGSGQFLENDVTNGYFIYSRGNITYTGMGHFSTDSSGDSCYTGGNTAYINEAKLFVNTMIAAYRTVTQAPTVRFTDDAEGEGEPGYYFLTADGGRILESDMSDSTERSTAYFELSDPNLNSDKLIACSFYYSLGGTDLIENSDEVRAVREKPAATELEISTAIGEAVARLYANGENGALMLTEPETRLAGAETEVDSIRGGLVYEFNIPDVLLDALSDEELHALRLYVVVTTTIEGSGADVPDTVYRSIDSIELRKIGLFDLK